MIDLSILVNYDNVNLLEEVFKHLSKIFRFKITYSIY